MLKKRARDQEIEARETNSTVLKVRNFTKVRTSAGNNFLELSGIFREAPVQFGSATVWGWKFRTVQAVPVFGSGGFSAKSFFPVLQYSLTGKDGSGSGFGSWKTVPAVPVRLSVSEKTVPTVPVSGSVPEPPCIF